MVFYLKKNIKINKNKEEKYLLFFIDESKLNYSLWQENNPWINIASNIIQTQETQKIKIPKGDLEDMSLVSINPSKELSLSNFSKILTKYDSETIVLVFFNFQENKKELIVTLKIIRNFQNKEIKMNFININKNDINNYRSLIIKRVIRHLIKKKEINFIEVKNDNLFKINIDIIVPDIESWIFTQNKLKTIKSINNFTIKSISNDLIRISIEYKGNKDIMEEFFKKGLYLQKNNSDDYFILIN